MNSITRARRRPRRASVNFRVFGWLLVREGFARLYYAREGHQLFERERAFVFREPRGFLSELAHHYITHHPERRFWL